MSSVPEPANASPWFVEELRQALGPLTGCSRLALAYQSAAGTAWLSTSEHCPCSRGLNGAVPCWAEGAGRPCPPTIEVSADNGIRGTIALCGPQAETIEEAVRRISDLILQRMQLQGDKDLLQEELSISWECLEAVYDITANLRTVQNTTELLEHIISKAAAIQEGLHIIFWLVEEDELEPVAIKHAGPVAPRPREGGLLGQALATRQSLVINDRARLASVEGLEAELRDADSAAIVPIVSRQTLLGALEVWRKGDQHPFDFRLMHLLDTLAILAATVIENDRLHRASLESDRLGRELEIGSRIQQTLLVGQPPCHLPCIHAAGLTIPSNRIDGDFYDFFEHARHLDLIVGDVMGKGIPAALLGAATKNHFLRAMNRLLVAGTAQLPQPKEIITILNPELVKQLVDFETFITLIYARFDLRRQCMDFIDCGHTKPIHYRHQRRSFDMLQGFNMPLGFSDMDVYEQVTVPFEPGDVFFFYSDGVTEARNEAGVQYGDHRLAEFIAAHGAADPDELVQHVRKEIVAWSASETFVDDLTCVAVKIQEPPAMTSAAHAELETTSALAELPRIRAFVRHFCQQHFDAGAVEDALWQLELGLTEAASNVMRHAYRGQGDQGIRVLVHLAGSVIVVRLLHRGAAFEPTDEGAVPPIEEPREGQMGRYIMQECLDEVKYGQESGGEQFVQLTKDLKPNRQGDA